MSVKSLAELPDTDVLAPILNYDSSIVLKLFFTGNRRLWQVIRMHVTEWRHIDDRLFSLGFLPVQFISGLNNLQNLTIESFHKPLLAFDKDNKETDAMYCLEPLMKNLKTLKIDVPIVQTTTIEKIDGATQDIVMALSRACRLAKNLLSLSICITNISHPGFVDDDTYTKNVHSLKQRGAFAWKKFFSFLPQSLQSLKVLVHPIEMLGVGIDSFNVSIRAILSLHSLTRLRLNDELKFSLQNLYRQITKKNLNQDFNVLSRLKFFDTNPSEGEHWKLCHDLQLKMFSESPELERLSLFSNLKVLQIDMRCQDFKPDFFRHLPQTLENFSLNGHKGVSFITREQWQQYRTDNPNEKIELPNLVRFYFRVILCLEDLALIFGGLKANKLKNLNVVLNPSDQHEDFCLNELRHPFANVSKLQVVCAFQATARPTRKFGKNLSAFIQVFKSLKKLRVLQDVSCVGERLMTTIPNNLLLTSLSVVIGYNGDEKAFVSEIQSWFDILCTDNNLEHVLFDVGNFKDLDVHSLPHVKLNVSKLSRRLKTLDLDVANLIVDLTDCDNNNDITKLKWSCCDLETLALNCCTAGPIDARSLIYSLPKMLQTLFLLGNFILTSNNSLPKLEFPPYLKHLTLSIENASVFYGEFIDALKELHCLKSVDLSYENDEDVSTEEIISLYLVCPKLQELSFDPDSKQAKKRFVWSQAQSSLVQRSARLLGKS